MLATLDALARSRGKELNIFRILSANPPILDGFAHLGTALGAGTLPPRLRELVVLRTAGARASTYEAVQHRARARSAGLSEDEIEAVLTGSPAPWTDRERDVIRATTEFVETGTLCDDTWQRLVEHFDDAERVEYVVLVSFYVAVAMIARGLSIPIEESS